MDKKDIVNALVEHYCNGNKSQFAKKLGIKPQTINTWIARDSFDVDLVYSKCEYLSAHWLLTGEGEMLSTPANSTLQNAMPPSFSELLAMLDQRDQKIEQLSRQLGMAEEQVRQLTKEKERLASSVRSSDVANAG